MTAQDAGVHWHLPPELRAQLLDTSGCLKLKEWLNNGTAVVVKNAAHRTVYRVELTNGCHPHGFAWAWSDPTNKEANEGTKSLMPTQSGGHGTLASPQTLHLCFHLKEYRAQGLRNRLREFLRPVKAKTEFDKATNLTELGINVPRPIGWGVLGSLWAPTASYLLSETVHDAMQLSQIDGKDLTSIRRQNLASELARFFARLHGAGVTHRDIHPGNLMVRWNEDKPVFTLIDLHEVQIHRRLNWPKRRENLIMLNRFYSLRATRTDRLRFWRAYEHAFPDIPEVMPATLEAATIQSNQDLWKSRLNHRLCHVEAPTYSVTHVGNLDRELVAHLSNSPDFLMSRPESRMLKQGGRSIVAATPAGVLKRINVRSNWERWKGALGHDPAGRAMGMGRLLQAAGLPTPTPLAVTTAMRGAPFPMLPWPNNGWPAESYLLTQELSDVIDLREFVDRRPERRVLRERIVTLARTLRQFHDRGFTHRDLKAPNILTPTDPNDHKIWFVDLAGVRFPKRVSRRRRIRDLARLTASFLNHPNLKNGDRLRFLLTYRGLGIRSKAGWRRWWRELGEQGQAIVADIFNRGRVVG